MLRLGADAIVSQQSTEPTRYRPWPAFPFPSLFRSESNHLKSLPHMCTHNWSLLQSESIWGHRVWAVPHFLRLRRCSTQRLRRSLTLRNVPSRAITCHRSRTPWKWLPGFTGESENQCHAYFLFEGIFGDIQYAHDLGVALRRKEELKAAREKRAKELKRGPGVEDWE